MSNIKGYHCDVVIVDEAKQITWEDMEVKEEVEPFGPSPAYITAATLEQMRLQQGSIEWQREYYGTFEWPDNTKMEIKVDPAACDGDIILVTEWHRGNIARCFGVPKGVLKADNRFKWTYFMEALLGDALCAPSRNQITGGRDG